jgi:hypothetical protein
MENKGVLLIVGTSLLILLGGVFSTAGAQIPALERAALIALYNSTDGDNWTDSSGWKEPPLHTDDFAMPGTEGTWHGIALNQDETAVWQLNLSDNNLDGPIPDQIGDLSNLEYLYATRNNLTGSIPAAIGNLSLLRKLYLYLNQLTGSIPSQLGGLLNLSQIWLNQNELSGSIPPELGALPNLTILHLYENQLTGRIPSELGSLEELKTLSLDGNKLTGPLPPTLTDLINLTSLNIGYNGLYADDGELLTFLNDKDPDWADTQTIAPEDVSCSYLSDTSLYMSWTPISYTAVPGGYQVSYSATPGGPYTLFETITDKSISETQITGLDSNTTYYVVIQSQTEPHPNNQNTVVSEDSKEAFATTSAAGISGGVAISVAGHDDLAVIDATASLAGTPYTATTDGSGDFDMQNVPSGSHTLIITAPNLPPLSHEFTLLESQSLRLPVLKMSVLTEQDLAQAIQGAVESWDVNENGKIELADIVWWLQILGGMRSQP